MLRLTRTLLMLLVLVLLPAVAGAQDVQREIVTAQVNLSTPAGTTYIGTVVGERTISGDQVTTDWIYNGTVNGVPADAAGTATERWISDGLEEVTVTSIITWNVPLDRRIVPPSFLVQQISPNLVSVYGFPFAIDRRILAPGSGDIVYTVTNPGQGSPPVVELPNTAGGDGLLFNPLFITLALVGMGVLFIVASRVLRKSGRRSQAATRREE